MPVVISQALKDKVLLGRQAVDAYREAHQELHSKPWTRDVPDQHTPFLTIMEAELTKQGYTMDTFWQESDKLNVMELGFADLADFEAKAKDADQLALEERWR